MNKTVRCVVFWIFFQLALLLIPAGAQVDLPDVSQWKTSDLINVIKDPNQQRDSSCLVALAIEELGNRKSVEAILFLVDLTAYPEYIAPSEGPDGKLPGRYGSFQSFSTHYFDWTSVRAYPAAMALIQIGDPCIPQVIAKIKKPGYGAEASACVGILVELLQKEGAKKLLEENLKKATDTKERDRLKTAIDYEIVHARYEGLRGKLKNPQQPAK
jgi:hypothetical protein